MKITGFIVSLITAAAFVSATPVTGNSEDALISRQVCDSINECDKNGCNGGYNNPNDLMGTCLSGKWKGCPCHKCGKRSGRCHENGCNGVNLKCRAGTYQGCPCW
ncbi:hypothetical protein BKA66DRAFT_564919 [Pyrenochaeta sp. MPI-SDFR-AT-0127]|nr:hypothetical protein BKA66DRAFT_564919 [Pyrenochaeta sp. MPI-SDFR-AT-0127]